VFAPPYRNLNEMAIANFTRDRLEILEGIETHFRIYEEALIGSLPFQVENPSNAKPLAFKELCDKKSSKLSFGVWRKFSIFSQLLETPTSFLGFVTSSESLLQVLFPTFLWAMLIGFLFKNS
jgi:hypothetical protein